jgi:hypothetical protein
MSETLGSDVPEVGGRGMTQISLDPKFDPLNLLDCTVCNNAACVRIAKSWSSETAGEAVIQWECSICHVRRHERIAEAQPLPSPAQDPIQTAHPSDPGKSPSLLICDLCTGHCVKLHSIGEVWCCGSCLEICGALGYEKKVKP